MLPGPGDVACERAFAREAEDWALIHCRHCVSHDACQGDVDAIERCMREYVHRLNLAAAAEPLCGPAI